MSSAMLGPNYKQQFKEQYLQRCRAVKTGNILTQKFYFLLVCGDGRGPAGLLPPGCYNCSGANCAVISRAESGEDGDSSDRAISCQINIIYLVTAIDDHLNPYDPYYR